MKRRLNACAIVLCLSCLCGLSLAAGNLVSDPGFEVLNPTVWKQGAWQNNPQAVQISKDSNIFHSGTAALKIANLKGNDSSVTQSVVVKANRVYRVSGWIETAKVRGTQNLAEKDVLGASIGLGGAWIHSPGLKGTQPWTSVTFLIKTGTAQTTLPVSCRLGYWGNTVKGVAWFDDISVEAVQPPAGQNIPVYGAMASPAKAHSSKKKKLPVN